MHQCGHTVSRHSVGVGDDGDVPPRGRPRIEDGHDARCITHHEDDVGRCRAEAGEGRGDRRGGGPGCGQHQATGVYDRITWGFVRYILGYRKNMAPRVRALITSHRRDAQVTALRSRAAVRRYLAYQVLRQLQADLQQAEAAAGPAGWRNWLLGMRNTYVH